MNTASPRYTDRNGKDITREEWLQIIEHNRNPFYRHPANPDQPIWRYIDIAKFLSMLEQNALFFPAAEQLSDPFEGAVSLKNTALIEREVDYSTISARKINPDIDVVSAKKQLLSFYDTNAAHLEWQRKWTYISCWHVNDYESAALWRLYSNSDDTVAIRSTFRRLLECLQPHREPPHGDPRVGEVYYFDLERELVRINVRMSTFFYKLKSFEHERELRAVVQRLPTRPRGPNEQVDIAILKPGGANECYDKEALPVTGIELGVDLQTLIDNIYISPYAAEWIGELVEKITRRYGWEFPIVRSGLRAAATYHSAMYTHPDSGLVRRP